MLDASAVLEWTLNRPKHSTIGQLLQVAVVPVSCLTEAIYKSRHTSNECVSESLRIAGADFEPIGINDALRAGQLISDSRSAGGDHTLSLADGICIAIGERLGLDLVSNDQYWETLDLKVRVLPYY